MIRVDLLILLMSSADETRSSADAVKPARRVWRSVKVTKHSNILYVRYSFLLCNSNFVFKTSRFYDIRLQKISWPWNGGQRSLEVIFLFLLI